MYHFAKANKSGFTLVEMVVVLSVISLLVTALVMSNRGGLGETRKQARDKTRMAALQSLQVAIEFYRAEHGEYPAAGCGATADKWAGPGSYPGSWGVECADYIVGLVPDYIAELPHDPRSEMESGKGFMYRYDPSGAGAYKVMVLGSVESLGPADYSDRFARCPRNYGAGDCNGVFSAANKSTYAIYSEGAEQW